MVTDPPKTKTQEHEVEQTDAAKASPSARLANEHSIEPAFKEESPSVEALKVRYQELHTHFRKAFDLYLKATTMLMAILGVSLGYVLQAKLGTADARLVCISALIVLALWYMCNVWAVRFYKSVTSSINESSNDLKIKYDDGNYKIFRVCMWAGMGTFIPIGVLLIYFLIYPPRS